jgi:hypothetical protein
MTEIIVHFHGTGMQEYRQQLARRARNRRIQGGPERQRRIQAEFDREARECPGFLGLDVNLDTGMRYRYTTSDCQNFGRDVYCRLRSSDDCQADLVFLRSLERYLMQVYIYPAAGQSANSRDRCMDVYVQELLHPNNRTRLCTGYAYCEPDHGVAPAPGVQTEAVLHFYPQGSHWVAP